MNAEVPGIGAAARYIGKRVLRKEDPRLLTGRGQFVDDISLPGMLHCAFARSPIARGRIVSIDSTAARDVPGVHAVYTAEDLAKVGDLGLGGGWADSAVAVQPVVELLQRESFWVERQHRQEFHLAGWERPDPAIEEEFAAPERAQVDRRR